MKFLKNFKNLQKNSRSVFRQTLYGTVWTVFAGFEKMPHDSWAMKKKFNAFFLRIEIRKFKKKSLIKFAKYKLVLKKDVVGFDNLKM